MVAVPLVSVVIPTYNQPALLSEALGSVFAQVLDDDYEVVVVNDGSTDDTSERLSEHQARHPGRLRVVTQENRGIGTARNRGIDEARGKYVALLDHDDLWMPGKLATQVEFMRSHPHCAACSVPWAYSTDPVRFAADFRRLRDGHGVVRRPLAALARGQVFLISSSIVFDKERARGLRYETRRQCIEDTPFQIGLFARGAFGIAGDEILMVYRWHESNYSSQARFFSDGVRMLRELDRAGRFAEFAAEDRRDLDKFLAHIGRTAAVRQLLSGSRREAMAVYWSEWTHQLAARRAKFLATFPLLWVTPRPLLRELFNRRRGKDA